MPVTKKDVEKIANLAKLKFSEAELESYTNDLNNILKYMEKLNELDTENVEPLSHPHEDSNIFRDDKQNTSLTSGEALKNAPDHDGKFFRVPKVIQDKK